MEPHTMESEEGPQVPLRTIGSGLVEILVVLVLEQLKQSNLCGAVTVR